MSAIRQTRAVVMERPGRAMLSTLDLTDAGDEDVVVDIAYSGISAGTERLLWSGRMPDFPGMGYPLVPGYESVGRVVEAGSRSGRIGGETVFVPGARCFGPVRGLFGGAAAQLVVPGGRALPIDETLGERGTLLALAATAAHAMADAAPPDLVVGHGVLGRLLARLTLAAGHAPPTVWESRASRRDGAVGYEVVDPAGDPRRDYHAIYDASGDAGLLDTLIGRLAPMGEIVLAGFYAGGAELCLPARLHARGAAALRRRVAAGGPCDRATADRRGRAVARRVDQPSPRCRGRRRGLPHGVRGP